jgi:hypothetical protein
VLVVRYRPEAVEQARSMVLPATRRRALLALGLAVVVAVAIAAPTLAGAAPGDGSARLLLLATLILPGGLAVLAVRRLRNPPVLPEEAFTVTRDHVVFVPQDGAGLVPRRGAAQRWDLASTTARVVTGDGAGRLEITTTGSGTPRTRAFPVDRLDVPATRVLQAIRRA